MVIFQPLKVNINLIHILHEYKAPGSSGWLTHTLEAIRADKGGSISDRYNTFHFPPLDYIIIATENVRRM